MGKLEEERRWILDQTRIDATAVEELLSRYLKRVFPEPQGSLEFLRYVLYRNLRAWREGKTEEVRGERGSGNEPEPRYLLWEIDRLQERAETWDKQIDALRA